MTGSLIKGLTIEIGADTQKFSKAVKDIDAQARTIAKDLKNVSESLKLNPKDAESYYNKLKLLEEAVSNAEKKVNSYKQAISKLKQQYADSEIKQSLYKQSVEELKQALESGKISQESYEKALKAVEEMYGKGLMSQKEYYDSLNTLERQLASANMEYDRSVNALEKYQKETKDTSKDVDKLGDEQKETNKEVKNFKGSADEATGSAKSFGQSLKDFLTSEKIKNGFTQLVGYAKDFAKALFNAGKELFKFSTDAVELAAQYKDAMETSKRAFAGFADEAIAFAEKNSVALGLYKGDMLEAMNSLGLMFSSMGLKRNEVLEMSEQLVILAADIRAAFGGDMKEILDALSRGFSTSTRNLRQFGVYISEAEIKAFALSKGIVTATVDQTKLNRALIDCEKAEKAVADAIAKYGEDSLEARDAEQKLIEKTEKLEKVMAGSADSMTSAQRETALLGLTQLRLSDIQGQANREADKYPALVQRIDAALKGVKETIGEKLLPVYEKFLTRFLEFTQSERGEKVINAITGAFENLGKKVGEILEDGTLEEIMDKVIDKAPQIVTKIGEITAKIIELSPALFELIEKVLNLFGIETEASKTKKAFRDVKESVEELADSYNVSAETMRKAITQFAEENGMKVADVYSDWETYEPLIAGYLNRMKLDYNGDLIEGAYTVISDFASNNLLTLQEIYNNWSYWEPQIIEYAGTLGADYDQKFTETLGYIQEFAKQNGLSLGDVLSNWEKYEPEITSWMTTLTNDTMNMEEVYEQQLEELPKDTQNTINKFGSIDFSAADALRERVRGWAEAIIGWFQKVANWVSNPTGWQDDFQLNAPIMSGESHAKGGIEYPGRAYRINDDAGHRPEVFVPATTGIRLNGDQTERILNNVNNSRTVGDLYIQVYTQSNTMTGTGEELGEAVLKKLRMSGVML